MLPSVPAANVPGMTLDYLAHLRDEAARFRDLLHDADLSAAVPTCPEWRIDDLIYHLAEAFLFWAIDVRERAQDPDPIDAAKPAKPADRAGLVALYDDAVAQLINALETTPDDVEVWTWSDDHSVGFVRRRMPHEALIHRFDAEAATGTVGPVDAEFAADGVHELLQHFHTHPGWADYRPSDTLGLLTATDTGDEWLVQVGTFSGLSPNTGKTYDQMPCAGLAAVGEPAFTVRASARDLDAWLWNRPTLEPPAINGSDEAFRAFATVIMSGVQ
jgi:uncharacterized protein (TIGR03083 family)